MKLRKILLCCLGAVTLLIATVLMALSPPPAAAASLVQVTNFGNNPSGLLMHIYVPDRVQARPPILVAVHYCGGSGQVFFSGTEFARLADQFGFIVIYPTATRSSKCFDVYTAQALRRNGGSD